MHMSVLVCDSGDIDDVTVGIDMVCDGGYVNSVCDRMDMYIVLVCMTV